MIKLIRIIVRLLPKRLRILIAKRKNIVDIKIKPVTDEESYIQVQKEFNILKEDNIFESEETLYQLSDYIKLNTSSSLLNGICHGIRNGYEVFEFRKNLNTKEIYGTDIHFNEKNNDPYFIKLDFHEEVVEWKDKFDFVYTNSLDHAHDPLKCLKSWCHSLKDNGIIVINFTEAHTPAAAGDPEFFSFNVKSLVNLISNNISNLKLIDILSYDIPQKYLNDDLIKKWQYIVLKKTYEYSSLNCNTINKKNYYESYLNKIIFKIFKNESLIIKSDLVAHQRYDWVKKISKNFTNLKILDLGSGNCYLSFHLLKKGNYITSVSFDNANNEKAYCRSKQLDYKNHKIIYKDINHDLNINNGNNLFDKVLLLETIEHIEDDLKLLININKLLLPNGELIISTPYKNFNSLLKSDYYLNIGPGSHVRHGYSITEIEAKLNKAGFEIVKYGYLTSNLANYTSQILRFLSLKNLNFISITFKFIFFIPIKFLSKYNMKKGNYISLIAKKK